MLSNVYLELLNDAGLWWGGGACMYVFRGKGGGGVGGMINTLYNIPVKFTAYLANGCQVQYSRITG